MWRGDHFFRRAAVLFDNPVEETIALETFVVKKIAEEFSQFTVVRLLLVAEGTDIVEVRGERGRKASAEILNRSRHHLLFDGVVRRVRLQIPVERTIAQKVDQNITEGLQVVTPGFSLSEATILGGIMSRFGRSHAPVARGLGVLRIAVLLRQIKVDNIDRSRALAGPDQNIVGPDVAVDDGFAVYVLEEVNEVVCQQEYRLERELATAAFEDIFQTGAEKIEYHDVVVTFATEPVGLGDTLAANKQLVNAGLMFGIEVTELDGNFSFGGGVGAKENGAGSANTELAYVFNVVLITDDEILGNVLASVLVSQRRRMLPAAGLTAATVSKSRYPSIAAASSACSWSNHMLFRRHVERLDRPGHTLIFISLARRKPLNAQEAVREHPRYRGEPVV